jgi:hypothetical protein
MARRPAIEGTNQSRIETVCELTDNGLLVSNPIRKLSGGKAIARIHVLYVNVTPQQLDCLRKYALCDQDPVLQKRILPVSCTMRLIAGVCAVILPKLLDNGT